MIKKSQQRIKQVIIIGGFVQALSLARQAKQCGAKVILFNEDQYSIARYSKAVDEFVKFDSIEKLRCCLDKYANINALLVPTSDDYIDQIVSDYDYYESRFVIGLPSRQLVHLFGDKTNSYQFAEANSIPHPKSWYISELGGGNFDVVRYPVIIKPSVMYSFNKRFHKKAILCETKAILETELRAIGDEYPKSQIILQEYLDGGAKALYSYGVFAVDGIPKAWVMANRIRQRPMDFGKSTTFAITCNISRIEELAKKILNLTHYTGLAEIEFMYDYRTEDYKFLEVNTRAWKWHNISTGLGFGFLSEMIHYYNKEKSDFRPEEKRIAWVEHTMDFAVILKEMVKGRMKWSEVVKSYRTRKVSAVWSIKDPLPAFANIAIPLWLLIKKRIKPK